MQAVHDRADLTEHVDPQSGREDWDRDHGAGWR